MGVTLALVLVEGGKGGGLEPPTLPAVLMLMKPTGVVHGMQMW